MTRDKMLSLHVQKLGHDLEEIRVRALNNIISKLDYGAIDERDLFSNNELVCKLLDWLTKFGASPEKETILRLITRMFAKVEDGSSASQHLQEKMLPALQSVRSNIESEFHPLVDNVISIVSGSLTMDSSKRQHLSQASTIWSPRATKCATSESVRTDIISISGQEDVTSDHTLTSQLSAEHAIREQHYGPGYFSNTSEVQVTSEYPSCFPHLLLPWQPLVVTDRHVLTAVEDSLKNRKDTALILHSCHFFNDVVLQDFPAEVFLQRPSIVKSFLGYIDLTQTGNSKRVCSIAMKCLSKLTSALHVRVYFYSDPCVANLKQETCAISDAFVSSVSLHSPSFLSVNGSNGAGDYLRNYNPVSETDQENIAFQSSRPTSNRTSDSGSNCDSDVEDSILLQLQQLNLPQFCLLSLYEVLPHLSFVTSDAAELSSAILCALELTNLLTVCVTSDIWDCTDAISTEIANHVKQVLLLIGQTIECHQGEDASEEAHRLLYLQLLSLTRILLVSLIPVDQADAVIPNILKKVLAVSVFDCSMSLFFPSLHADILLYVEKFSGRYYTDLLRSYNDTKLICDSFTSAIKFLKYTDKIEEETIFSVMTEALPSLAFHMDLNFVSKCVDLSVNQVHRQFLDADNSKCAIQVLVRLLAHCEPEVQLKMYESCHQHVLAILGVHHVKLLKSPSQLSFLYNTSILIEIICHGAENSNKRIEQYSGEMLVHLLKGKFLMPEATWLRFLESLIPTLPLLQCYSNKSTVLGRAVAKMLDPDISSSILLPQDEVLKGNLRLLFCADPLSRDEAVSRLMWLLSKEKQSYDKLPALSAVHGTVLNTLCIVERPTHLARNRYTRTFYQASSLSQVVELLVAAAVEPIVKRSALTQISVMLEDRNLHAQFLDQNGIDIILDIFYKALLEKDYLNHPDSVIPIITILKNLVQHNPKLRQKLSTTTSLHYCILRSIFMYCNDNRLRHDGSQLLFLLLYSDLLLSVPEPSGDSSETASLWYGVSLPEVVARRMRVPFLCHTHWRTSHHTETTLRGVLMNDERCHRILKLTWNIAWYERVSVILAWQGSPPSQQDFSQSLQLDEADINSLKATNVTHCCRQHLYGIQNATSHHGVTSSVWSLTGYLTLHMLVSGKEKKSKNSSGSVKHLDHCWDDLEWEKTLVRFLKTPPSNNEDEGLLVNILQFVRLYLKIRKGKNCFWISKLIKDPDQPLPRLLNMSENGNGDANPHKELCREMLFLAKECATLERKWKNLEKTNDSKRKLQWVHMVQTLSQNLKFSDTEHFYNLSFLDWMLMCLANLSGSIGWSVGATNISQLWKELITSLIELVKAFHCGKAGAGTGSFLGLSITRNSILCMNHLLCEMQEYMGSKGWEKVWLSSLETNNETSLTWLASLWQSRDPVTRAGALQLSAGLCSSRDGCSFFMTGLNVWASGIIFLLDHDEACLVREQAAILLTNLSSHSEGRPLSLCSVPQKHGDIELTGTQALIALLKQYDFFGELAVLLSRLYVGATVDLGGYMITVDNGQWTIESLSGRQLAPGADLKPNEYVLVYNKNVEGGPLSTSSLSVRTESVGDSNNEEQDPHVLTTPTLVKSVGWLLVNLLGLIPEEVLKNMVQLTLPRTWFRCLHEIPLYSDESRTSLTYVDVLELNTSICSLLAKCVPLSEDCCDTLLHTHDSLYMLLSLLNPVHYPTHLPHLLFLRNRLWTSVFKLLSAMLCDNKDKGYEAIRDTLFRCGYKPFFETVKISMEDISSSDLLNSALASLTSILSQETKVDRSEDSTPSLQSLLDTPRSGSSENELAGIRGRTMHTKDCGNVEMPLGGGELCELLLRLYEVHRLQQDVGCLTKGKAAVIGALASLLGVSQEAKYQALSQGLVEVVILQLREIHVKLTVETIECLRRIADKKRVCPVLKEVNMYFGLLTNFLSGCAAVKIAAAEMGLADLIHKLWVWCSAWPSLLHDTLKMMCTFTSDCSPACQSLVLTTTVPGIGLRKTASSMSFLHAVLNLITKEMELISRQHKTQTLAFALQLLKHACLAQECRVVIGKGNLFQSLSKLHPTLTKRQKHWEKVELLWLEFMLNFTAYPEGQLGLPKIPDALEILITLTNSLQKETRKSALSILRNISFHQFNRSRLLASGEFLQLLQSQLSTGSMEEKCIVASMVWALIANNQKAKLIVKCTGIDAKLQEVLSNLNLTVRDPSDDRIQMLSYVLSILRNEDIRDKKR